MKIDFRGTYESLVNVVNHRPRPVSKDADFGKLLGDVNNEKAFHPHIPLEEKISIDDAHSRMTINTSPIGNPSEEPDQTPLSLGVASKLVNATIAEVPKQKIDVPIVTPKPADVIRDAFEPIKEAPLSSTMKSTQQPVEREPTSAVIPKNKFQNLDAPAATVAPEKLASYQPKSMTEVMSLISPVPEKRVTPKSLITEPKISTPNHESITSTVSSAGQKYGIDPTLGLAVAHQESGLNHRAISADGHGSKGLFQLLDNTGKDLMARQGYDQKNYDPFNPELNADLGMSYLRYLHDIFSAPVSLTQNRKTFKAESNESLERFAVAAFNAGEGRVASAQRRAHAAGQNPGVFSDVMPYLPRTTQSYVTQVLSQRDSLIGSEALDNDNEY